MAPLVTIGLPVYNGENYLEEAVQSVLAQDFSDFELIIRDNASTDNTETICRRLAREDPRISYARNERNAGAAPNFNALVAQAQGQYFKWIAHDDIILPGFVSECLAALEREPEAVLACSTLELVDSEGAVLKEEVAPRPEPDRRAEDRDRVSRFGAMLLDPRRHYEVFGLIRLPELRRTRLIGSYQYADWVLLAHLALLGKFATVENDLFLSRCHEGQSNIVASSSVDYVETYAGWFDVANANRVSFSCHRAFRDYLAMVSSTPMSSHERVRCYALLSKWTLHKRRFFAAEWKRWVMSLPGRT